MLNAIFRSIFGTKHERDVKRMRPVVATIAALEPGLQALSDDALRARTTELRQRLADVAQVDDLLPEAYAADITYGTNNEFGFDYLRDNMQFSLDDIVQREHYYAIVDEVDSILIDEARTPLIISGRDRSAESRAPLYEKVNRIIPRLKRA